MFETVWNSACGCSSKKCSTLLSASAEWQEHVIVREGKSRTMENLEASRDDALTNEFAVSFWFFCLRWWGWFKHESAEHIKHTSTTSVQIPQVLQKTCSPLQESYLEFPRPLLYDICGRKVFLPRHLGCIHATNFRSFKSRLPQVGFGTMQGCRYIGIFEFRQVPHVSALCHHIPLYTKDNARPWTVPIRDSRYRLAQIASSNMGNRNNM